jgi:hypothetical protein
VASSGCHTSRKIDQKTEMNQGSEYISLIEDRVLYKTVYLLFPHLDGEEERQPEVPKRPFQETNGTKILQHSGKISERIICEHYQS